MKTKASFTIFKLTTLAPFAVALTAVLITQPVFAQTTNSIVITENSSTSLTATYSNGSVAVTPLGPDDWSLVFPSTVFFGGFPLAWTEPENPSVANVLTSGPHDVSICSDISTTLPTIVDDTSFAPVGTDSSNGGTISMTFDDDAATAETSTVPDTGSTLGLLFLALIALFGANRLRSFRLA